MIASAVLLFLCLPYLLILFHLGLSYQLDVEELLWALKNTIIQAGLSALGALLLGFLLARGLVYIRSRLVLRWHPLLNFFLLLPNFLPPLYILLVFLSSLEPFPMGFLGIVLIHSFINMGIVAFLLERSFYEKLSGLAEMAAIEGAGFFLFWKNALSLLKKDFMSLFFLVFTLCFSSFAIPLIAGGGMGTTLEVLIFEKIRISGDLSTGLSLALLQLIFILSLSFLQGSQNHFFSAAKRASLFYLPSFAGALFFILSLGWFVFFAFKGMLEGIEKVEMIPDLWNLTLNVLPTTFFIGLVLGLFIFILLMLLAYDFQNQKLQSLLKGFVVPSTALVGFSFLFWPAAESFLVIKYILGLALLFFPTLYRIGWFRKIEDLKPQLLIAQQLGASKNLIFKKIIFPQTVGLAGQLAGMAALWAMGDFALARMMVGQEISLSMVIDSLMNGYRLEAAMALSGVLLLLSLFVYTLFFGVSRVFDRTA